MSKPTSLFEMAVSEFRRSQNNSNLTSIFKNFDPRDLLKPLQMKSNIDIPGQLQKLVKNLTSSFNKITKTAPTEDFNEVVKGFLPQNARLITPKFPLQAGTIRFADLDGDLEKELITSYVLGNETTTLVLKKQNDRWHKISEINEPNNNEINYMGFASLTGDGKRQLLIGRKDEKDANVLHSYNLSNGKFNKMFSRNYHKFDVVGPTGIKDASVKKHLAFWDRNTANAFNVDIMHWNGNELRSVENNKPYYLNNVIPYYGRMIKQMPNNPSHWYHFADSLMNCGMYRDGLAAINYGLKLKPTSPTKEEFLALKTRLEGKIKT